MTLLLLIFFVLAFLMLLIFEPYLDVFKCNKKYHVILWYTDLDGERQFLNIIGG